MDIVELGCAVLRERWIEWLMKSSGFFGHAVFAGTVGLFLWLYGHTQDHSKFKQIGTALLIALATFAAGAEAIKRLFQLLHLQPFETVANVSIHTGCAFVLAAVLAAGFPAFRSILFLCATLAALSRLYFHGAAVTEIFAGAILGATAGIISVRYFIATRESREPGAADLIFGFVSAALATSACLFFYTLEKNVQSAWLGPKLSAATAPLLTVDFGSPQTRPFLRHGWSGDESWFGGKQSVVWATGLGSEIILNIPKAQPMKFRLHLLPFGGRGPSCQRVQVQVNDTQVAPITLKHGWQWYEVMVPQSAIRPSNNSVQFFFDYAESPRARTGAADDRNLSVAFDRLEIAPGS